MQIARIRNGLLQVCALVAIAGGVQLTGCAQLGVIRSSLDIQGAQAADRVRDDAEFIMCRGITIGAWVRKYGSNPQQAEAWKILCSTDSLLTTPAQ